MEVEQTELTADVIELGNGNARLTLTVVGEDRPSAYIDLDASQRGALGEKLLNPHGSGYRRTIEQGTPPEPAKQPWEPGFDSAKV